MLLHLAAAVFDFTVICLEKTAKRLRQGRMWTQPCLTERGRRGLSTCPPLSPLCHDTNWMARQTDYCSLHNSSSFSSFVTVQQNRAFPNTESLESLSYLPLLRIWCWRELTYWLFMMFTALSAWAKTKDLNSNKLFNFIRTSR